MLSRIAPSPQAPSLHDCARLRPLPNDPSPSSNLPWTRPCPPPRDTARQRGSPEMSIHPAAGGAEPTPTDGRHATPHTDAGHTHTHRHTHAATWHLPHAAATPSGSHGTDPAIHIFTGATNQPTPGATKRRMGLRFRVRSAVHLARRNRASAQCHPHSPLYPQRALQRPPTPAYHSARSTRRTPHLLPRWLPGLHCLPPKCSPRTPQRRRRLLLPGPPRAARHPSGMDPRDPWIGLTDPPSLKASIPAALPVRLRCSMMHPQLHTLAVRARVSCCRHHVVSADQSTASPMPAPLPFFGDLVVTTRLCPRLASRKSKTPCPPPPKTEWHPRAGVGWSPRCPLVAHRRRRARLGRNPHGETRLASRMLPSWRGARRKIKIMYKYVRCLSLGATSSIPPCIRAVISPRAPKAPPSTPAKDPAALAHFRPPHLNLPRPSVRPSLANLTRAFTPTAILLPNQTPRSPLFFFPCFSTTLFQRPRPLGRPATKPERALPILLPLRFFESRRNGVLSYFAPAPRPSPLVQADKAPLSLSLVAHRQRRDHHLSSPSSSAVRRHGRLHHLEAPARQGAALHHQPRRRHGAHL